MGFVCTSFYFTGENRLTSCQRRLQGKKNRQKTSSCRENMEFVRIRGGAMEITKGSDNIV